MLLNLLFIQLLFICQICIFILRWEVSKYFSLEYPEEYPLYAFIILVFVLISLLFIYLKGDTKVKNKVQLILFHFVLSISFIVISIFGLLLIKNGTITQNVVYDFYGITILKWYWSDAELFREAIIYVKATYGEDMLKFLNIPEIVISCHNNMGQLQTLIDSAVFDHQNSFDHKFFNMFGLSQTAVYSILFSSVVGLGVCVKNQIFMMSVRAIVRKIVDSWYPLKSNNPAPLTEEQSQELAEQLKGLSGQIKNFSKNSSLLNERIKKINDNNALMNKYLLDLAEENEERAMCVDEFDERAEALLAAYESLAKINEIFGKTEDLG